MHGSGSLGVVHWRLMKQKQYSSTPLEPSPGGEEVQLDDHVVVAAYKGL